MRIVLPARMIGRALAVAALVFVVGTLGGHLYKSEYGRDRSSGLVRALDVDAESSVPTWFSSVLLLLSSGLLAVIGSARRANHQPGAFGWYGLAIIFLGLSIDEATTMVHEMFETLMKMTFDVDDPQVVLWIVPYSAFALVVLLAYRRFLGGLPVRTRSLMLVAGGLYVAGAMGGDAISMVYLRTRGDSSLAYVVTSTIEELLEMGGIILFFYTLLDYLPDQVGEVHFRVDD